MPSVSVKLYSVFFKFLLKHRLQNRIKSAGDDTSYDPFGVTTRPEESVSAQNPLFTDGVATKDIHIDPLTSLSVRIFLPESALTSPEPNAAGLHSGKARNLSDIAGSDVPIRRNSFGSSNSLLSHKAESRRNSYACTSGSSSPENMGAGSSEVYRGYSPSSSAGNYRKLPVMLQFHGGGWVSGSNDSVANDLFCRRMAKHCDVIVLAVGYRL